MIKITASKKN